jgi:hypothetical protein
LVVALVALAALAAAAATVAIEAPFRSASPVPAGIRTTTGRVTPMRVLAMGDSLLSGPSAYLQHELAARNFDSVIQAYPGSGLIGSHPGSLGPDGDRTNWASLGPNLIETFDPDVVIVEFCCNYWPPYPSDAAGQPITFPGPQFDAAYTTTLDSWWNSINARPRLTLWIRVPQNRTGAELIDALNQLHESEMSKRCQFKVRRSRLG